MKAPRRGLVALAAMLALGARGDQLIVLNEADGEAALVDPATLEVTTRIPTGRGPHQVAVTPDGTTAFVTNYGGWIVPAEPDKPRLEAGHTVTVLDLTERKARATWDLGAYRLPHGIAVSPDGARVWITAEGKQSLVEVATATGRVERHWSIAQHVSHGVVATPDGQKLYVANVASGTVTVIRPGTGKSRSIATGAGSEGLDVSGDGREVWVANRADSTIAVIDSARDEVVATFGSGGKHPTRLRFSPDGKHVWVSNSASDSVTVFETATRAAAATVAVSKTPAGLAFDPQGLRLYVACSGADRVVEIDTATRAVRRSVATGREPIDLAWAAGQ